MPCLVNTVGLILLIDLVGEMYKINVPRFLIKAIVCINFLAMYFADSEILRMSFFVTYSVSQFFIMTINVMTNDNITSIDPEQVAELTCHAMSQQ